MFEKLVESLYNKEQYKEALDIAMAMESQLSLTFTSGAADMLNKVEEHIKKYVHVKVSCYIYIYVNLCTVVILS